MTDGWHGESLLDLVASGVGVEQAAQRLLEDGADVEVLSKVEGFLRALDADPSVRDRALLLVERTRLLAERGVAGAQRSDLLRADASHSRAADVAPGSVDSVLVHELSTPITVARTALELVAAQGGDRALAEQMVGMALRNLRLAGRLLTSWGRAEHLHTGRVELSWGQVELGALVGECVAEVEAVRAAGHGFAVTVERAVTLPADPDAVRQILFNLLLNAVKFSPPGSRIELTVSVDGVHARVAVCDRGPGVAVHDRERIFEAGQRLDAHTPGTGLGLFVARQLARAHGGELTVDDASGGSRFVLHLPLSGAEWQRSLGRREQAGHANDARRRERDAVAHDRDVELDRRESVADQRDDALAEREALAYRRDTDLDRREER